MFSLVVICMTFAKVLFDFVQPTQRCESHQICTELSAIFLKLWFKGKFCKHSNYWHFGLDSWRLRNVGLCVAFNEWMNEAASKSCKSTHTVRQWTSSGRSKIDKFRILADHQHVQSIHRTGWPWNMQTRWEAHKNSGAEWRNVICLAWNHFHFFRVARTIQWNITETKNVVNVDSIFQMKFPSKVYEIKKKG